jgi:glycosyltransferase involved in cell wall biosynthesis
VEVHAAGDSECRGQFGELRVHTVDYLLRRTPLYSAVLDARFNQWNSDSFDRWLRHKIEPCDALIAISGAGLTTGPKVQAAGGKFICDRGSTHQRFQDEVLAEEHRRWRVPYIVPASHIVRREEAIYGLADAITVPSTVAQRSFVAMGVAAGKVHVIPDGVRLDRFTPGDARSAETFEVLFAGRISLRKGIPYLLEAFARLQHPGKHLTLAGSVQDDVRQLLAKLPTEHVTFAGNLPQPELAARMTRSHVLALASVEEGLALVQGQAMACGCPVAATTATGAKDLFANGVEGFIVPDRDTTAFADRLQQLADNPALRERMGAAALERVKTLGGRDDYGERWDRLLHALTAQPKDASESS